jgi:hypothetical protein
MRDNSVLLFIVAARIQRRRNRIAHNEYMIVYYYYDLLAIAEDEDTCRVNRMRSTISHEVRAKNGRL